MTNSKPYTSLALFALLAIRFPVGDFFLNLFQLYHVTTMPAWTGVAKSIQDWTFYYWENCSFLIIIFVIIVNRSNLRALNIDNLFIAIFFCSGLLFAWSYFWPLGWVVVIASVYMAYLLIQQLTEFGDLDTSLLRFVIVIIIVFFTALLAIGPTLSITKFGWAVNWIVTRIPFVASEEVIFRGLLWMFLKNLSWSETKIVAIQAVLFWLSHVYYMFTDPMFFWLITPIASVVLGIIVKRFRSITPSTVGHMLFNVLWGLIKYRDIV